MNRNRRILSVLVALMLVLAGCSLNKAASTATSEQSRDGMDNAAGMAPDSKVAETIIAPPYYDGDKTNSGTTDRKLVKKGTIALNVDQIEDTTNKIKLLAEKYNGYVYSSSLTENTGSRYLYMTIKVAAANFDAAMTELNTLGRVQSTSMNVFDVTTQFMDLESRLSTLKVKEQTLVNLLAKAEKIEDILNIENNLQYTRQEIEYNEGQLNLLKNTSDYSEINISANDNKGLDTTQPQSAAERFLRTLTNSLKYWSNAFLNLVESLIFLLPVLIPAGIIAGVLGVRYRKRSKARRSANTSFTMPDRPAPPEAEPKADSRPDDK